MAQASSPPWIRRRNVNDATNLTVGNSVITGTAVNGIDVGSATVAIPVSITNTTFSNISGFYGLLPRRARRW